jgi:phenylalanyl-tRNA synthetase beta chain
MRVPLEWLHEYCAPHMDAHTLAELLALSGTEVERVEHHGVDALENFVVGQVLERHKHPDADRLSVCMVDIGGSTASQIVCGAPNVAAGQTVGVAKPGSIMPDGSKLRKAKLRGQESNGMILAEDEVGIGLDHEGIMVLDETLSPGTPLADVLPISTDVLVLEITPNRPDCLGIYGVAREVAATTGAQLKPAPWEYDSGTFGELAGIEIINQAGPELCPRFTARIFENVKLGRSPRWLKARLMAAGQRPISNVVDVTNYVMLLTGQPMHAFDYDRVAGRRLTVRPARPGEQVQTLDGQSRTLDEQMLVIDDADGPTSIAGVMGGARSEVSDATTTVLSEVATWNGPNIHRTGLRLALRSEASSRFEKQLQPEQAIWAQVVATKLFVDICGATVRPGTLDLGGPGPAPITIRLREQRVEALLGAPISSERSGHLLKAIGFGVTEVQDGLDVTVPDFRRDDITREADVIEEVARLDGLEKLPATLPARHAAVGALTATQKQRRRAVDALTSQGLHEIVGWSFTGPDLLGRLRLDGDDGAGPATRPVMLANPMSSEQSQLRTTLLGSLLDVTQRNLSRGVTTVRLFEAGAVYLHRGDGELPAEPHHLAALLTGPMRSATWRDASPAQADFFTAKGVLAGVLDTLGVGWDVTAGTQPFLHPGRTARVAVAGHEIGWVGELHPNVASKWDLEGTVAVFEVDLDAIPLPEPKLYRDLVSFPEVREDLAVVVGDGVAAADVLRVVIDAGSPLVAGADVFDVYRDAEKLGEGNVSLAIRLAYRAADRTLTDAEVARQRQPIVNALEKELGGRIRGGD